jgi:hypothetical protein
MQCGGKIGVSAAAADSETLTTVEEVVWSGGKNGRLLRQARGEFDVPVTVDRNPPFQHRVIDPRQVVIVLKAPSNCLQDLLRRFLVC